MKFRIEDGLPYVQVTLTLGTKEVTLERVLLDTGSAGTIFRLHRVSSIGLVPEPDDAIRRIVGVGGAEFVFVKRVDSLSVGELRLRKFGIEVGNMDYGMEIDGILGTNFLHATQAVVSFRTMDVST